METIIYFLIGVIIALAFLCTIQGNLNRSDLTPNRLDSKPTRSILELFPAPPIVCDWNTVCPTNYACLGGFCRPSYSH